MTKCLRFVLAICVATTLHFSANAQSLSINTTGATADPSAILDVTSTTKGMLIPRMDKTQKAAIATPATGLLIYQTLPDSIGFHYYDGTQWVWLSGTSDSTAWKITGNSNITSSNFLGTLNDSALRFRVKNMPSGIVDSASANTALGFQSLASITSGVNNTAVGYSALRADTSGSNNVAIGLSALRNKISGSNNVAIGVQASFGADTVTNTTAIGRDALYYNKHHNNFAVGFSAGTNVDLQPVTSPTTEVTYVGTEAGYAYWVGSKTTGVGYRALWNYDTQANIIWGSGIGRNTAVGDSAMALTYASRNVAVGTEALSRARASSQNVAIGDSSMGGALNTVGNVAIGYKTLSKQQGQGYNTAVGYFSQRDSSVNTIYNTSIGAFSMEYNRTGIYNTGLGLSALRLTDSASYNTAVGADAMYFHRKNGSNAAHGAFALRGDSAGYWNTALGSEAMDRHGLDATARGTGFSNVAVGFRALRGAREAFENTAVGAGALEADSSGNYNTAVGRYSSFLNKRGDFNVSLGFRASNNADTASSTTAIGAYAGAKNKQDNNVTIGYAAGYEAGAVGGSDPKEITFVGYEAGRGVWASNKNTSLGFRALSNTDAGFGFYDYVNGRNTAIGDSAMAFSIGGSNVVVGAEALANSGVAGTWNNVAIGDSAMGAALSNSGALADNVAIGFRSLTKVRNQGNIAVGAYAGRQLGNTVWNTAIGYHALETTTTGNENTVVGTSSFRNNVTGSDNVGVGINTGFNVTSSNNTYIGSYSGEGAAGFSTGHSNTGVGYYTLSDIRSGIGNTAIGRDALRDDTSGNYNVAIGLNALQSNLGSDYNTAVGNSALTNHKRDGFTYNTAIGASALEQDSSGFQNTGVGVSTFRFNKTGYYNTGVGINAGYYAKKEGNTFIGAYSGMGERSPGSNVAADTGTLNSALGLYSLYRIAQGSNNTAIGYSAMYYDSSGNLNTAVGNGALYSNRASHMNNAFGWNALYSYEGTGNGFNSAFGDLAAENLESGLSNVAIGSWAMRSHITGSSNTAVGNSAMGVTGTSGSSNTAVGSNALLVTNADGNTAVGRNAGNTNTTGTNNTLIGFDADVTAVGLTNATAIGYNATVAQSNSLVLGQTGTDVGIGTTTPAARLDVAGDFKLGTNGTVLTQVVKTTISLITVPSVGANSTFAVDYAVPNAQLGGTVAISPSTLLPTGVIIGYARVISVGNVRVSYANIGGSASTATAGISLYITVIN